MNENHKDRGHADYGPSSAGRWMSCSSSVPLTQKLLREEKITEGSSSLAADTGTFLHEIAERKLRKLNMSIKKLVDKEVYIRPDGTEIVFTSEMCEKVESAVKEARAFMKNFPDAVWEYEVKLEPADGFPEIWGTADILGIEMGRRVIVADFKFGDFPVKADGNKQFKEYCRLGAQVAFINFAGTQEAVGKVIQPSQNTEANDYVIYDAGEMLSHIEAVEYALENEHFEESDSNCRFCPAKSECPQKTQGRNELAMKAFSDTEAKAIKESLYGSSVVAEPYLQEDAKPQGLVLPPPSEVTPEMRQHLFAFGTMFQKWWKEFVSDSCQRASNGEEMEGLKLVVGRKGNRKWNAPDAEVISQLTNMFARPKSQIVQEKVISPAQAEKTLSESEMLRLTKAGWFKQEDGKATLALADDKRKDYDYTALFTPVSEGETNAN